MDFHFLLRLITELLYRFLINQMQTKMIYNLIQLLTKQIIYHFLKIQMQIQIFYNLI